LILREPPVPPPPQPASIPAVITAAKATANHFFSFMRFILSFGKVEPCTTSRQDLCSTLYCNKHSTPAEACQLPPASLRNVRLQKAPGGCGVSAGGIYARVRR